MKRRVKQTKLITSILLSMALSLFSLQPASASISFDQVVSIANTPEKLAQLMKSEFRFEDDRKLFGQVDHWQSPEEIWDRKAGDCEDYALFAQYVLKKNKVEAEVVSIYGADGYAHTIVIFKEDGLFRILNQAKLERFRAKSMSEAIGKLNPGWIWAAIAEQKAMRGKIRETIFNHSPVP